MTNTSAHDIRSTGNASQAQFLAPQTHQTAARETRVVVMNGSRIGMAFDGHQWWNVSVAPASAQSV
ncbi:hypothetical protein EJP67_33350 [Variovorax guangxiensis]|uniref:Uncharacterized protein n=1 Tax=Variovorax guangxiensis TaxID=1775474 RepID=A0A3S0Z9Y7_9BURK|nr:hypothetical protein [Variovorax guangxiensis]RUR71944.1 hypothetical protein EJP67_33350 [Variovorax guangxiensis]